MGDSDALRGFLARLLGWTRQSDVDQALRSIDVAVAHHAHLVLCGTGDLVPIAFALHRRTLGADRPFVMCDPHRGNRPASARSPASCDSGIAALAAAAGGSLCVRRARLPDEVNLAPSEISQLLVAIGYEPKKVSVPKLHRRAKALRDKGHQQPVAKTKNGRTLGRPRTKGIRRSTVVAAARIK
jgi:hypothetical protein